MSTAFAAIEDAIIAALQAAPAIACGAITRNRSRPLGAGVNTAVVVHLESAQATETVLGAHDWATLYAIECYARSQPAGSSAEAEVHALLADVYARLAALHLPGLGVMHIAIQPAIDWQRSEDATAQVCAALRLAVMHRTPANQLTPWT